MDEGVETRKSNLKYVNFSLGLICALRIYGVTEIPSNHKLCERGLQAVINEAEKVGVFFSEDDQIKLKNEFGTIGWNENLFMIGKDPERDYLALTATSSKDYFLQDFKEKRLENFKKFSEVFMDEIGKLED